MIERTYLLASSASVFVERALDHFQRATGFQAQLIQLDEAEPVSPGQGAHVELTILNKPRWYAAIFQSIDRVQQIKILKSRSSTSQWPQLLIAPALTASMAAQCRDEQLAYLDGAGNAFIRGDDHYILIDGQKPAPEQRTARAQGSATPAALRVVFALIRDPALAAANYRDLARAAGTALGTISTTLKDLQSRRLLSPPGKATRRVLDSRRLLDDWAALYPLRLRSKLNARRFTAPDVAWWQKAELPPGAVWGGEVAADHYTGFLKPERIVIYLDPAQERQIFTRFAISHRLRSDPAGAIEILDRFWPVAAAESAETRYAHPALVYADLIASADSRNQETAQRLKAQYLADADDASAASQTEEAAR